MCVRRFRHAVTEENSPDRVKVFDRSVVNRACETRNAGGIIDTSLRDSISREIIQGQSIFIFDLAEPRALARSLVRSDTFFLSQWKSTTRKGASFVRKRGRKSNDIADDVAPLSASLSLSFFFSSLFVLALKACARSPIYPTLIVSAAIFLLSAAVFFFTLLHPLFCRVKRDGLFRLFSFEKYLPYTSSCFHFGLPAAISVRVFPHCGCILPLSILRDRDIPENNKFLDYCVT